MFSTMSLFVSVYQLQAGQKNLNVQFISNFQDISKKNAKPMCFSINNCNVIVLKTVQENKEVGQGPAMSSLVRESVSISILL